MAFIFARLESLKTDFSVLSKKILINGSVAYTLVSMFFDKKTFRSRTDSMHNISDIQFIVFFFILQSVPLQILFDGSGNKYPIYQPCLLLFLLYFYTYGEAKTVVAATTRRRQRVRILILMIWSMQ